MDVYFLRDSSFKTANPVFFFFRIYFFIEGAYALHHRKTKNFTLSDKLKMLFVNATCKKYILLFCIYFYFAYKVQYLNEN